LDNVNDRINIIYNSLLIKKGYVENDPYDRNWYHKSLSLWHTIANVIETLNTGMRHWESVRIWIYISLLFSMYKYSKNEHLFMKIREFIYKVHNFNYKYIELSFVEIINILKKDKISINWNICFAILKDIGKISIIDDLPYSIIKDGFEDVFTIK
jgi:3-dehydroquinate synthetase